MELPFVAVIKKLPSEKDLKAGVQLVTVLVCKLTEKSRVQLVTVLVSKLTKRSGVQLVPVLVSKLAKRIPDTAN